MKPTKSLPVLFATVMALTGTTIATAKDIPADGSSNAPVASAQMIKAHFRGHRGGGHGCSFVRHDGSDMVQQLFRQVDVDGDGSITQAEVDAFRATQVSAADADGDGVLSIEEFDTIYRELTRTRMVRAFQGLDTDGDGIISSAEMDARFGAIVKWMDRNGDSVLSIDEHGRGGGPKGHRHR